MSKLIPGNWYMVAQKVNVRGTPQHTYALVLRGGIFVRETKGKLMFRGFEARKHCIVRIAEESDEAKNLVETYNGLMKSEANGGEKKC